ncbi:hypothetical protein [Bartonella sp. B39]
MFKIFKNRMFLYVFTAFILFSVQTVDGNASIVTARFQEGKIVLGKNTVMETVDKAVIRDDEGQGGLAFGKIEKVSLFTAFWGSVDILSLLSSLLSCSTPTALIAIISLLL